MQGTTLKNQFTVDGVSPMLIFNTDMLCVCIFTYLLKMATILNDLAMKAQKRNRDVIENFICECFVTVRGVLCQGRDSEPPPIGERLVIEVEKSSYGVSLVLLKSSTGGVVGRVKKEEANTLLPFFLSQLLL